MKYPLCGMSFTTDRAGLFSFQADGLNEQNVPTRLNVNGQIKDTGDVTTIFFVPALVKAVGSRWLSHFASGPVSIQFSPDLASSIYSFFTIPWQSPMFKIAKQAIDPSLGVGSLNMDLLSHSSHSSAPDNFNKFIENYPVGQTSDSPTFTRSLVNAFVVILP
jgi:hypothetical protein